MESKYLLEIDEDCLSFSYVDDTKRDLAWAAAKRLQKKCIDGQTIVMVRIKNPRCKAN